MNGTPCKRVSVNQHFLPMAKPLVQDAWVLTAPRMGDLSYTEEGSS